MIGPVRHIYRGIILDTTSSKGIFKPYWSANLLISDYGHQALGGYIYLPVFYKHYFDFFQFDDRTISQHLCQEIERVTIPFLTSMQDMEAFYLFDMHRQQSLVRSPALHFQALVALGQFDLAQSILDMHRDEWSIMDASWTDLETEARLRRLRLCAEFDRRDLPAVGAALREIEQASARSMKVEHLWEPSPFPFERA